MSQQRLCLPYCLFCCCLFCCLFCCSCRSEEALYELLAAVEPNIVDMRVIKDKYTGEQPQPKHCRRCGYTWGV